jgi:hypothetical protein
MMNWSLKMLRAAVIVSIFAVGTSLQAAAESGSRGPGARDVNLTPANLMATAGPLVTLQSRFALYESRYAEAEQAAYAKWVAGGRNAANGSSHYGALRSRYQWSLRRGLPVGRSAPVHSIYSHGAEMIRSVVKGYFMPRKCAIAPHEATNLADIEMLYLLEGDPDALECIKGMGLYLGAQYREDNLDLSGPSSDPRSSAILLQVLSAGARYELPYSARESWGSTWGQAGVTIVGRISRQIRPSGKVVSLAHRNSGQGDEAFFMNAMLATELLRWHGFVEPQPAWLDLARRIVDHLTDEHAQRGGACLPYTSNDGNACASDLAGFYVWPALVLWQETGDARYRKFALMNLTEAGSAFVSGAKQFNQTYSTGAQSAEALLAGVSWRRGGQTIPATPDISPGSRPGNG